MKLTLTILLLLSLLSCFTNEDRLEKRGQPRLKESGTAFKDTTRFKIDKGNIVGSARIIHVSYGAISCPCPQWFETRNMNDTLNGRKYFYLEQGKEGILNADTLFNGSNLPIQLELIGQFYEKEGYPKNFSSVKGNPEPARVFRYSHIKIIQNG